MVLAECAVVAALAMVAWHMVASPPARAVSAPVVTSAPAESADNGGQVLAQPEAPTKAQGLSTPPGLNIDTSFWRMRLAELNRAQASFEALEWRIVHSSMAAARRYIQSIVVPAITRAERR
jgi:hypothetical protein